ncbi:MAG: hypothetical protein WAT35_12170 [Tabrizicola sp.]|jgi:hypothetical protein|uniref:hypothetical protein n=1 Tax=Tabrizicola sp. TaxID=2005166 RepID=UPI003BAEC053
MTDLLGKLSTYHFFNYLLPGAIFSVLADRLSLVEVPEDAIQQFVWFYFVGLVLSRIGSLIFEPILGKLRLVEYESYEDYLRACEADTKIEVMVEVSNTYRTLATGFVALLVCALYFGVVRGLGMPPDVQHYLLLGLLSALFLLSFRKQAYFVTKRVKFQKDRVK